MPVTYEIQGSLLRMELVGDYEPADIIRVFLDAIVDPKAPKRIAMLMDVSRSASLGKRSPEEIRMVAEFLGPYADRIGGRCAVVADSTLFYGLSRMGSAYSGGVGIESQVFRDAESALVWLGVNATI